MKSGIYLIINIVNGKVYVGQSVDVKARIRDHKRLLKKGNHNNPYLSFSYKKHGAKAFRFKVMENCSVDRLDERERHWIEKFQSTDRTKGYNLESGGNKGKVFAQERIASITGKGNPMYGRRHSKEFVKRITLLNRGSSDKLDEKQVEEIKVSALEGVSQGELADKYGVTLSTINKIVKGKNWAWVREDLNDMLISLVPKQRNSRDEQIRRLWNREMPAYKIAEVVGCDPTTVSRVLEQEIMAKKDEWEHTKKLVEKDFLQGKPREEILEKYGISKTTYVRITSPAYNQERQKKINRAHELKKQGLLNKDIAKELNIHRTTVTEYLKNEPE